MESSPSKPVLDVDVSSGFLQRWDAVGMAINGCAMERSPFHAVLLGINVGSGFLQHWDAFGMTMNGCAIERSVAQLVLDIDVGSGI
jgi:hypothetical protein